MQLNLEQLIAVYEQALVSKPNNALVPLQLAKRSRVKKSD